MRLLLGGPGRRCVLQVRAGVVQVDAEPPVAGPAAPNTAGCMQVLSSAVSVQEWQWRTTLCMQSPKLISCEPCTQTRLQTQ